MRKSRPGDAVFVIIAGVLSACASHARAQDRPAPTLGVGDDAPPLSVDRWVKGGPHPKLEKGTVYVLEFWATWCGPCAFAMPRITRIQKEYADQGVVVIGVSVWEREAGRVEPFLKEKGDKIGYAIATDQPGEGADAEGRMATTWMRAAGLNAIPATFIVDRAGKIAWIGHPWRMDGPLRAILAGRFDAKAEAAAQPEAEKRRLADEAALAALLSDRGSGRALTDAVALVDRLIALDGGSLTTPTTEGSDPYGLLKLQALMAQEDYAAANALAARLVETLPADGGALGPVLNVMAWAPDLTQMDTDLMLRLAKQEADAARPGDWKPQRMLARVHAARGEFDQAIAAQRRALAGAPRREQPWEEARLKVYLLDQEDGREKQP